MFSFCFSDCFIESLLDLNMALCKLKIYDYDECIINCKMSIQINDTNPKAYYRWADALIGKCEYKDAKIQSMIAYNMIETQINNYDSNDSNEEESKSELIKHKNISKVKRMF